MLSLSKHAFALVLLTTAALATSGIAMADEEWWRPIVAKIPQQQADALERLRFLAGTWHCEQFTSDKNDRFAIDETYKFLPGDDMLQAETVYLDAKGGPRWMQSTYIGWGLGGPGHISAQTVAKDGATYSYAGWINGTFTIFRRSGEVVTLNIHGPNSIDWVTAPGPLPKGALSVRYSDVLRKCLR